MSALYSTRHEEAMEGTVCKPFADFVMQLMLLVIT